jgi:hypothetical protein
MIRPAAERDKRTSQRRAAAFVSFRFVRRWGWRGRTKRNETKKRNRTKNESPQPAFDSLFTEFAPCLKGEAGKTTRTLADDVNEFTAFGTD